MSLLKEKVELKLEETEFTLQKILNRFTKFQKIILLICVLGALPSYFLAKAIGNYYFKKIYNQELISANPSFKNPKDLLIDRTDIATLGNDEFAVVVQIVNQNLTLATKDIGYQIDFLDDKGMLTAQSQKGKFNILPNERKFLIAPKIISPQGVALAKIKLLDTPVWRNKLSLPKIKLITTTPKGRDQTDPFGYVLDGNIYNQSPYLIKEVKLNFLLYGTGGKIIGASFRSEFDLPPNQKRDYKHIWPGISGKNVVRAEVVAETDLLNSNNLVAPLTPVDNESGSLDR